MKSTSCFGLAIAGAMLFMLMSPEGAQAADPGSLNAYYRSGFSPSWVWYAIAAVVSGGIVIATGGTGGPIVAAIGTGIGKLLGLSGIAATNAGLALLGGGSLASGGLGMVGGAALLTAALSFGAELVVDPMLFEVQQQFSQRQFEKDSANFINFALPRSHKGSAASADAIKALKAARNAAEQRVKDERKREERDGSDRTEGGSVALPTQEEREKIKQVSEALRANALPLQSVTSESLGDHTLLAMLHFIQNDYEAARETAASVIAAAPGELSKTSLAEFILAASELQKDAPDYAASTGYFERAWNTDGEARFRPLMLAIYLDRLEYRYRAQGAPVEQIDQIHEVLARDSYGKPKVGFGKVELARRIILLKYEQQRILALTGSNSESLRSDPAVLDESRGALRRYLALLDSTASIVISYQNEFGRVAVDYLFGPAKWEKDWQDSLHHYARLLDEYAAHTKELQAAIDELAEYQRRLAKEPESLAQEEVRTEPSVFKVFAAAIFAGLAVCVACVIASWRRRVRVQRAA